MYVCLSVSISSFAIYSKNLQDTHSWKFVTLLKIVLQLPLWKKKSFTPFTALLGHPVQKNIFFALI